ncbi:glycosyltransferase family 2 protein [Candidatus Nitrospira salsa]
MSKLVTIGIPTYNRAHGYLPQALESAIAQTYENLEIIVSDNCSSDDTETVVKEYGDPRVKYFKHQENIGPLGNSNFCLTQAKGIYFLQLHDDDVIDSDFIEVCMKAEHTSPNVGVIRTGVRVIDANGNVIHSHRNAVDGSSLKDYFLAWFENKTSWYLCNTLFQTKGLQEGGGFHSKRHHVSDGVAIVYMAHKFGRADIEDVKASFRRHAEEITFSVTVKDWCLDYHALLEQMCAVTNHDSYVRKRGAIFFSKMNYRRATTISSKGKRLWTFFMIYRLFHFAYPPDAYVLPHAFWNTLRLVKRICKQ